MPIRHLLAAAVVVASLTACTSADGPRASPTRTPVAIPTGVGSEADPFAPYMHTEESARLVSQAMNILVRRCLLRFGVDVPLPERAPGLPFEAIDDQYGLWRADEARLYGYRGKPPPAEPDGENLISLIPEESRWLINGGGVETHNGVPVPEGGCQDEALRELGVLAPGESGIPGDLVGDLIRQAFDTVFAEPEVQRLIGEWSACMSRAGYNFTDPFEPFTYWLARDPTGRHYELPVSQEQLDAAMVDIDCKTETGLLSYWRDRHLAEQRRLVEEHAIELAEELQEAEALRARAAQIVNEG